MNHMSSRKDGSKINDGINDNTYEMLFKDYPKLPEEEWGSRENAITFCTLNRFTLHEKRSLLIRLQDKLDKLAGFDINNISFDEENSIYHYKRDNEDITFNKMSDYFPDKNVKKELHSDKRFGSCHTSACGIAFGIENAYVVTGYLKIRITFYCRI